MPPNNDNPSLADLVGPWMDPDWESGLIQRCKAAWNKPLAQLTNRELATFLCQRIATNHILPVAKQRLENKFDDDTEIYEGELKEAVDSVPKATKTAPDSN